MALRRKRRRLSSQASKGMVIKAMTMGVEATEIKIQLN